MTDHADALSSSPNDNLFTVTLLRAPESLAVADVVVSAGMAGQTSSAVNFVHNDTNADGKLDANESLSCKEPPLNLFDGALTGKTVRVSLALDKGNGSALRSVATADWVPN